MIQLCELNGFTQGDNFLARGQYAFQLAQYDTSIFYLKKAEVCYKHENKKSKSDLCSIQLLEALFESGAYSEANNLANELQKQALDFTEEYQIRLYTVLTGMYASMALPEKSNLYYFKAIKLTPAEFPNDLKAELLYQASKLFYLQDNFQMAYSKLDSAIALYGAKDLLFQAKCLWMKQFLAYREKNWDAQYRYTERIGILLNELNLEHHPLRAKYYEGQGVNFLENSGNYKRAEDMFMLSFKERSLFYQENHLETAAICNWLGILSRLKKNKSSEFLWHRKAMQIRRNILGEYNYITSISYMNLGNYYRDEQVNNDSAIYYYNKAADIRKKVLGEKHAKMANSWLKISELYYNKKDLVNCLKYAHLAMGASHPFYTDTTTYLDYPFIGNYFNHEFYSALRFKAYALSTLTNLETSSEKKIAYYKACFNIVLGIDSLYLNQFQHGLVFTDDNIRAKDLCFNFGLMSLSRLLELTQDGQYYNKAIEFIIRRTATELFDETTLNRCRADTTILCYFDLKVKLLVAQKEFILSNTNNSQALLHKKKILDIRDSISQIITQLRIEKPDFFLNLSSSSNELARRLLDAIPEHTAILAYSGYTEGFYMSLLLTKNNVIVSPTSESLHGQIENFSSLIQEKRSLLTEEYSKSAFQLYKILFPESIIKSLRNQDIKNLIIVPYYSIWNIPFECLITDSVTQNIEWSSLPYLINDYTISYSPSLAFALKSLQNKAKQSYVNDILLIAPVFDNKNIAQLTSTTRNLITQMNQSDSLFGMLPITRYGNVKPLPYSEKEVLAIKDLYNRNQQDANVLLRQDAHLDSLRNKKLNYKVIHIASHAYANRQIPDLSGIFG